MRKLLAACLCGWFAVAATPPVCGAPWIAEHEARLHEDVVALGFGNAVQSAADPYDDSVWIATDASLLLHFASDGSLEHGTTLPTTASALAVGLDRSVWLFIDGQLIHFNRAGTSLETRGTGVASSERASAIAIDSLRDVLWIATTKGLYRL